MKKYLWAAAVGGSNALKRLLDISASSLALLCFSPLFAALALSGKRPFRRWETRVGQWGREFPLPQLPALEFVCVLRGDMSLFGPRPSLSSDVARFTLLDRRRLDVKPGLFCLTKAPREPQIPLDIQFIESQSRWLDMLVLLKTAPVILSGKAAF